MSNISGFNLLDAFFTVQLGALVDVPSFNAAAVEAQNSTAPAAIETRTGVNELP